MLSIWGDVEVVACRTDDRHLFENNKKKKKGRKEKVETQQQLYSFF